MQVGLLHYHLYYFVSDSIAACDISQFLDAERRTGLPRGEINKWLEEVRQMRQSVIVEDPGSLGVGEKSKSH